MRPITNNKLTEMQAEFVVGICRNMVKFIHGNKSVIECLDTKLVHGEAKCCMGADQYLVGAFKEGPK